MAKDRHVSMGRVVGCGLLSQTYRYNYDKQQTLQLSASTDHFFRAIITIAAI